MEGYTLAEVFLTFLIYAFLGWCLEVGFHIFKSKKFINRGFLQGPLCPIYGVGAVMVLGFLGHLEKDFWTIFIGGAIFASFLELVTGYVLEKIFDTRWWDYSHKRFNIGGYISLDFSLIWGLVSVIMMEYLQPLVGGIVDAIPDYLLGPVALIFFGLFLFDLLTTVKSLLSFRLILKELSLIRGEMDRRLNKFKSAREKFIEDKKEEYEEELERLEEEWEEESRAYERKLGERLRSLNTRLEKRHRDFLDKYPAISSEEIRERLKNIRKKY